jgi:hypothetical protein
LAVIVLALMAGGSIKLMTQTIEAVLAPLGIRGPAIEVTLELVVPHLQQFGGAAKGTAAFPDEPASPQSARAFVERTRWARSAAYVLNGSRRVSAELDQAGAPPRPPLPPSTPGTAGAPGPSGEPGPAESLVARTRQERVGAFGQGAQQRIARTTLSPDQLFPAPTQPLDRALEKERRYFAQHLNAERSRLEAARRVDQVAARLGTTTLGWHAVNDSRTTSECRAANGHNFDVVRPPAFGYPGTLHGGTCRCKPGPPFPGQSSVDEFVQTVARGRGEPIRLHT